MYKEVTTVCAEKYKGKESIPTNKVKEAVMNALGIKKGVEEVSFLTILHTYTLETPSFPSYKYLCCRLNGRFVVFHPQQKSLALHLPQHPQVPHIPVVYGFFYTALLYTLRAIHSTPRPQSYETLYTTSSIIFSDVFNVEPISCIITTLVSMEGVKKTSTGHSSRYYLYTYLCRPSTDL